MQWVCATAEQLTFKHAVTEELWSAHCATLTAMRHPTPGSQRIPSTRPHPLLLLGYTPTLSQTLTLQLVMVDR